MPEAEKKIFYFIEGGGEMGTLTRAFDWSSTSVGPVDQWPQSLRTIVDIMLHSEVPMLLWWGHEMIQLYNDAFRPSLGENGKHPAALGQRGEDCWPETWPIIKPLIDRVRQGGATWSEDQLIPIYRNGKIEDVYWTFGYSPVQTESGEVGGVLVICNETTGRVRALQKIEENERTLRSIILHAPVGICIIKGNPFTVEVANDICLELVGKPRSDFEGKPLSEVFPEIQKEYTRGLAEVARTGVPLKGREQPLKLARHGTEELIYIDFVFEPVRGEDNGRDRKVMVLAIDVTDKVLARKKIEESEQRYKTLISESTVAIASYSGPELRIQYVNDTMMRYWGKDSSIIGKTLPQAVPELTGQSFFEKLTKVYRTGETYTGTEEEARLIIDGELKPCYINFICKALRDSQGVIYGIHNMAMDVTEQVMARKKVEQSEANLRNIILKSPVAMCILRGPRFIVEIANDRMFALWGKERDQLQDKPLFEGLPEIRNQGFEEILEGVYSTEQTYTAFAIPANLPRDQGVETVYINFVYEPFRDPEGKVSGIMAVAINVTDQVKARHRMEELIDERARELQESNKSLQQSNDELAQFAYIASHDLQEPARKISTFIEMLQGNLKSIDSRSRTLLEKIEQGATRMLSLIRDILTYSQLTKEIQQPVKIDLSEVLESIKSDFELLIEEKGAIISGNALPTIEGIPVQINQLFTNLLSNALKFTHPDRHPVITISSTLLAPNEVRKSPELKSGIAYYRLSFHDNGIGFKQIYAHQVFDIFERLHPRSHYQGTGIGLAMCKKIAQNHNGDIEVQSVESEGTTFHVFLPVK